MNRITRWISLTERCSFEYKSHEMNDIGLCPHLHMYIFCLCNNPGVSQEELAKMIHINKSNVARSLKVLLEDGFINKEIDKDDKRISRIFPTDKAYELLPKLRNNMKIWNEIIMDGLSVEEQNTLYELLKKVAVNACNYTNKKYVEVDD